MLGVNSKIFVKTIKSKEFFGYDFNWSATSIISGNEYYYPAHCRWVWEGDQIVRTNCYVDPAAIFAEVALFQETNQE